MKAVEFTTEFGPDRLLRVPEEAAVQLTAGRVRVIILTRDSDDQEWRAGAYEQFARDDSAEDAVYDSY